MPDSEGNPLNEAEARALLHGPAGLELWRAAASYVVPIYWVLVEETDSHILHNGSGFFLRVEGPTLLVTAAHVIRRFEADRALHGAAVKAQVMNVGFDPLKHLVDIDDSIDIATISVPDNLPERVGKWVYQRPASGWPPAPPTAGRGLFFTGFPGILRTELATDSVEYGLYGGLLTATTVSDDNVVSQLNRDHVEPLSGLDAPPMNAALGGMSGAPGWTLTQVGWRLAGVLYEYSQDYELFYCRRADRIRPDGSLVRGDERNGASSGFVVRPRV